MLIPSSNFPCSTSISPEITLDEGLSSFIDFASSLPGLPGPKINIRIVMSPEHTKRLLNALAENVGKYEAQFGTIMLEGAAKGSTFNLADMVPNGGAKS